MKIKEIVLWLCLVVAKVSIAIGSSVHPPLHHNWTRSEKMDPNGILQFQWHLRDKEIVFKVTMNSRGFVAIGFLYQNPKFSGFDMALAWIHDRTGKANILVGFLLPRARRVSNLHEKHLQLHRYLAEYSLKAAWEAWSIMKNAFSRIYTISEFPFRNDSPSLSSLIRVRINSI